MSPHRQTWTPCSLQSPQQEPSVALSPCLDVDVWHMAEEKCYHQSSITRWCFGSYPPRLALNIRISDFRGLNSQAMKSSFFPPIFSSLSLHRSLSLAIDNFFSSALLHCFMFAMLGRSEARVSDWGLDASASYIGAGSDMCSGLTTTGGAGF